MPPTAVGTDTVGGAGGGRYSGPRWFGVVLAMLLAIVGLIGALWGLVVFGGFIGQRPAPLLGSALLGVAAIWAFRRRWSTDAEALWGRTFMGAICGGVVGEAVGYLIAGVPPGAPSAPGWLLVGALGIGGAIGAGVAIIITILASVLIALRLLLTLYRTRRHAG